MKKIAIVEAGSAAGLMRKMEPPPLMLEGEPDPYLEGIANRTGRTEPEPRSILTNIKPMTREFRVVVKLEDGRRMKVTRDTFRKCFLRAIELDAVSLVDGQGNLWVREGKSWLAQGTQRPIGKMKRIK